MFLVFCDCILEFLTLELVRAVRNSLDIVFFAMFGRLLAAGGNPGAINRPGRNDPLLAIVGVGTVSLPE